MRLWLSVAFAAVSLITAGAVYLFGDNQRALVAAVLVGMLAGFLIAVAISHRVGRLAGAAGKMAAGDFDVQMNVSGPDELGDLARALESMRASLKESFGVLTADRNKLTAIFDGLTDAVMVVDEGGSVRFSNSAAAELLDSARASLRAAAAAAAPRRRGRLLRPPGAAHRRPRLLDAGPLPPRRARRARRRPRPHRGDAPRVRRIRLRLQCRPRAAQPAGGHLRRDRGPPGRRQGRPPGPRPLPRPPRRGRRADGPPHPVPARPRPGRGARRGGGRGRRRGGRRPRRRRGGRGPRRHPPRWSRSSPTWPPRATPPSCARC